MQFLRLFRVASETFMCLIRTDYASNEEECESTKRARETLGRFTTAS